MARRPKTSPNAGKPASAIVVHRIFPGHLAEEGIRRSVKAVAEDLSRSAAVAEDPSSSAAAEAADDMSAAAVVAVAAVGDAAAAGAAPTSASRKMSSRWRGSTTVLNSIAFDTKAAIELFMWASWRRR
jgi:hypothetical protein